MRSRVPLDIWTSVQLFSLQRNVTEFWLSGHGWRSDGCLGKMPGLRALVLLCNCEFLLLMLLTLEVQLPLRRLSKEEKS